MILKGEPGGIVNKKIRKPNGRHRIVPWFKFDENGLYEIEETKIDKTDLVKLMNRFEVVNNDLHEMSYPELKHVAKEKGINSYKKSKEELIKLLEVE